MKNAINKLSWVVAVTGILVCLISTPLFAQQCPELIWYGDYEIQTQEDLDDLRGYIHKRHPLYSRIKFSQS